jgi:type IV secretory pathway VirB3-like protein
MVGNPDDPFYIQTHFYINLLPAIYFAHRRGLLAGIASLSIIFCLVATAPLFLKINAPFFPWMQLFVFLIFVIVVGDATNFLLTEIKKHKTKSEMLSLQFNQFTNSYYVMKIAHDQVKEHLANTRISIREAMSSIRDQLYQQYQDEVHGLTLKVGKKLLNVFSHFCSVQIAAIYTVNHKGKLDTQPLATLGTATLEEYNMSLAEECLKKKQMVSLKADAAVFSEKANEKGTELFAVIPIKDANEHVWGVITVLEMPFDAFNEENLNLMQLIGAYTGDLIDRSQRIFFEKKGSHTFREEIRSLHFLAKNYNIFSSIVSISLKTSKQANIFHEEILERMRGLDSVWLFNENKKVSIIFLLLPLMNHSGFLRYRFLLNEHLRERVSLSVEDIGGRFNYIEINHLNTMARYDKFISEKIAFSYAAANIQNKRNIKVVKSGKYVKNNKGSAPVEKQHPKPALYKALMKHILKAG